MIKICSRCGHANEHHLDRRMCNRCFLEIESRLMGHHRQLRAVLRHEPNITASARRPVRVEESLTELPQKEDNSDGV